MVSNAWYQVRFMALMLQLCSTQIAIHTVQQSICGGTMMSSALGQVRFQALILQLCSM